MNRIATFAAAIAVLIAGGRTLLAGQLQEPGASQIAAQSQAALTRNDYDSALILVKEGLKRFPDDETLQLQLARVYVYQKQDRQAMDLLDAVLRKNPSSRNAKLELAQIYGYRDDFKQSDRLYRELLTASADDEPAALGLIHNLVQEGKRDEARRQLREALARHPNSLELGKYSDYLADNSQGERRREKPGRIQAGESYFSDNSGNRALDSTQRLVYQLSGLVSSRFRLDETSLWKPGIQKQNVISGTEEIRLRLNRFFSLRGGGGAVRFADSSSRPLYSGDLELFPWKNLLLSGGFSRFAVSPTVESTQFNLLSEGWHSRLDYRTRNSSLTGSLYLNHYSDGNHVERESGEALRWFGGNTFAIGTGYAFRHLHFSQQLNHGYFSPSQYRSHLGAAAFRVRIGKVYRGEYLGYGGVELEGVSYTPAGELRTKNDLVFGKWELGADYSRFQLIQSSGAFRGNAVSATLGYKF